MLISWHAQMSIFNHAFLCIPQHSSFCLEYPNCFGCINTLLMSIRFHKIVDFLIFASLSVWPSVGNTSTRQCSLSRTINQEKISFYVLFFLYLHMMHDSCQQQSSYGKSYRHALFWRRQVLSFLFNFHVLNFLSRRLHFHGYRQTLFVCIAVELIWRLILCFVFVFIARHSLLVAFKKGIYQ